MRFWWSRPEPSKETGEHACCKNCIYFADHSDPEDDPDEVDGYCTYDFVNKVPNEYGGHWTHSKSWCGSHEFGEPIWVKET